MSEYRPFYLINNDVKARAIEAIKNAPAGYKVTITKPPRSLDQNARYWSRGVLWQIADQARVGGQKYTPELWHELFKKMFLGVEQLPDGSVIGKSSTKLTVSEFSKFIEQVEAYAVTELGVVFVDEREVVAA